MKKQKRGFRQIWPTLHMILTIITFCAKYGAKELHMMYFVTFFRTEARVVQFVTSVLPNLIHEQLKVLELFLDCMTEPNEKLVEFGVGGSCNCCADQANVAIVSKFGGIPLIIQCLLSPVRNTVNYALGALYYVCNEFNKEEILKPKVVDTIKSYIRRSSNPKLLYGEGGQMPFELPFIGYLFDCESSDFERKGKEGNALMSKVESILFFKPFPFIFFRLRPQFTCLWMYNGSMGWKFLHMNSVIYVVRLIYEKLLPHF
ncbi:uncharacterized protein LOC130940670 isoform X3 [Arachis stenosperma]|uniref:uncharacterized protein LOC130940670 isoform X3 n=1 Tax=Arachis stenosperma TaxID=217475 RepID=UPI0025AD458F|nr:uncharacterized protein LOC130940670 isoform X3 [Arachis stenosperma]